MYRVVRQFALVMGLLAGALASAAAYAHAFPVKSSPTVGGEVATSPKQVRIWFDADLNALFSKLTVDNGQGQQVSEGHGMVAANNPRLLEADVKPLAPGQYWAKWSVVARDGHHTEGKFPFNVK